MPDWGAIIGSLMKKQGGGEAAPTAGMSMAAPGGASGAVSTATPGAIGGVNPNAVEPNPLKEFGIALGMQLAGGMGGGAPMGASGLGKAEGGAAGGEQAFQQFQPVKFMQGGGELAPGEQAVVGEQGPELIQARKPLQVVPKGPAANAPPDNGILSTLLSGVKQGLVMATAQGREMRFKEQERKTQTLLAAVQSMPELADSPEVQKTLNRYFGDKGETLGFLAAASRGKQGPTLEEQAGQMLPLVGGPPSGDLEAQVMAQLNPMGAPVTPAMQQQARTAAGGAALRALPGAAGAAGMGVAISPKSGITLRTAPPSRRDADEATVMQRFQSLRDNFGMDDVMAAKTAMQSAATAGLLVPEAVRKMAFAQTDNELNAARTGLAEHAKLQEQLKSAGAIAAEKASGTAMGAAAGAANVAFQTMRVKRPNGEEIEIPLQQAGAFAATGAPQAVSLGKNPSKSQLSLAARQGVDFLTGPDGAIISVPVGVSPGSVSAAEVEQGPEAITAISEVQKTLDDISKSKEFAKAWPSEKGGRVKARGLGYAQSFARRFTDSPQVLTLRGRVRQLGFRMARLLGSNSQLSDTERENAQAVWQPVIDGTATLEQVQEAYRQTTEQMARLNRRRIETQPPGVKPGPGKPLRGAAAAEAVGGTIMELAANLSEEVRAGRMTADQAEKRLATAQRAKLPEGATGTTLPGGRTLTVNVGGQPVTVEVGP